MLFLQQMSDDEAPPPVKKEKRKVNEAQLANLRKGMETLKAKRETLYKEREEFEEMKAKGELPPDAPKPKLAGAKPKPAKVVKVPASVPDVMVVDRKIRTPKPNPMLGEMAALRAEVASLKIAVPAKEVVVEKEVVREVDRVVHKDRVITGSDMLNQIFGFK